MLYVTNVQLHREVKVQLLHNNVCRWLNQEEIGACDFNTQRGE